MERRSSISAKGSIEPTKIYVVLIGSAPMASLDALMLSLERFKDILTSDSARERFETTLRSIQPSLTEVNAFIDAVYAPRNPTMSVNMKGLTLIVEIKQTENEFLECVHDYDVEEILSHVIAVGTMPPKKLVNQKVRNYTAFPVKYEKGRFIKLV